MGKYDSALRKALTASSASGTSLIPEDLEPIIRANLLELSPLARMVPVIRADGNVHKVVRRTANIGGWFEGEMTPASYSQSTYGRRSVEVKIMRTHGQASDFMVSAGRSFTDVMVDEIDSATEGMADLFEYSTMWGMPDDLATRAFTGDAYQYGGVYAWVLEDAAATNVIDADGTITLTDLDNLMDITVNKYRNVRDMQYLWFMSPSMISKVGGLQTLIRRQTNTVEFEGGFIMDMYRGIPILSTGFVKPSSSMALTSATETGSGGTIGLGDGVYRYKVTAVTLYGEQAGGAMQSATVTAATHDTVELVWTAVTGAKLYCIYRTGAGDADDDDNYDLVDVIAAWTYNADGSLNAAVTGYSDDGSKSGLDQVHPQASTQETIFLVGLGQNQGVSRPVLDPVLGEPMDALVKYVPLVETTDSHQFRLKSYHTLQVPWGQLHGVIRRASVT